MIVNKQEIRKLFDSLPKKWRQAITKMLQKSKQELPLLNKEIENFALTLQNIKSP